VHIRLQPEDGTEGEMSIWKHGAVAIVLATVALLAQPASAAIYKTSCYKKDCVRIECDDRGTLCSRLGYFARDTYDVDAPSCYAESVAAPSGGTGPAPTGCGSGPKPQYHYLNHFDPNNDFIEYPGLAN
jgi:hypothetical protein